MMRLTLKPPPKEQSEEDDTPPIALQLVPTSNPSSDSPRGNDWNMEIEDKKHHKGIVTHSPSQRPAFLMPTAEVSSPRAVTGRTINNRKEHHHRGDDAPARDQATSGRT